MDGLWENLQNWVVCCGGKSVGRYQPEDDQEAFSQERISDMAARVAMYEHIKNKKTNTSTITKTPSIIQNAENVKNRIATYENLQSQEEMMIAQKINSETANIREEEKAKQLKNQISSFENFGTPQKEALPPPQASKSPFKVPEGKYDCCAACRKRIYPRDPTFRSFGETLHISCFNCNLCDSKMARHPLEVQFWIDKDTLFLLCSKCQEQSILSQKEMVLGRTAGERIEIGENEEGDVDRVMDAIGDELEEIFLDNVPKCEICGADFLQYTGEVSIVGALKYHKECFERGKPAEFMTSSDRRLTPLQAFRYLPERLIVRLQQVSDNGSSSPILTLFFVWSTKAADFQRIQQQGGNEVIVSYRLDQDAAANKRKPPIIEKGPRLFCELVGNPLGVPCNMTNMVERDEFILFRMGCSKFQLQHHLSFHVRKNNSANNNICLDLTSAMLTVQIPKNQS